jgi:hypothetical protein
MADTACSLEQALGQLEPCPGPACSFWLAERGEERCVLKGVERELVARPAVSPHTSSCCAATWTKRRGYIRRAPAVARGSPVVAAPFSKKETSHEL